MWQRLFSKSSVAERGTMYQLRNLLNRTVVPANPEKNMKAAEDFLLLLVHAHVVAAAEQLMEYDFDSESVAAIAKSIVNTHLVLPTSNKS